MKIKFGLCNELNIFWFVEMEIFLLFFIIGKLFLYNLWNDFIYYCGIGGVCFRFLGII